MLPVTVANVIVSDLLARKRFAVVPWLVAIAIGYCWTINSYLAVAPKVDHFAAFKGVIQRLGIFALLLLAAAALFTFVSRARETRD
jgi:hypothetical protein